MFSYLFHAVIYNPIYNTLVFVLNFIPNADAGIAIIIVTLLVKFILFPLSLKTIKAQIKMKEIQPQIDGLKEKYKDDRQELARKTMEIYSTNGINPFAGILLLLAQLPILIALYQIFYRGGLPEINKSLLYFFVPHIDKANMMFIGLFDLHAKSLILAVIAGLTQFVFAHYSMPKVAPSAAQSQPSFAQDFAKSFQLQAKFLFPFLIGFIAYTVSGVVALYIITSNVFMIAQEIYVRNKGYKK